MSITDRLKQLGIDGVEYIYVGDLKLDADASVHDIIKDCQSEGFNYIIAVNHMPQVVSLDELTMTDVSKECNSKPKRHVYHAGRIFSDAAGMAREYENSVLEQVLDGVATKFSPLFDNEANEKDDPNNLPSAYDILWGDIDEVLKATDIIAEIDGEDPGVVAEIAIALASNIWRELVIHAINDSNSYDELMQALSSVLESIPHKAVFSTISDNRVPLANMYEREFTPVGFNQLVIGALHELGFVDYSFEDSVNTMLMTMGEMPVNIKRQTIVDIQPSTDAEDILDVVDKSVEDLMSDALDEINNSTNKSGLDRQVAELDRQIMEVGNIARKQNQDNSQ